MVLLLYYYGSMEALNCIKSHWVTSKDIKMHFHGLQHVRFLRIILESWSFFLEADSFSICCLNRGRDLCQKSNSETSLSKFFSFASVLFLFCYFLKYFFIYVQKMYFFKYFFYIILYFSHSVTQ